MYNFKDFLMLYTNLGTIFIQVIDFNKISAEIRVEVYLNTKIIKYKQ